MSKAPLFSCENAEAPGATIYPLDLHMCQPQKLQTPLLFGLLMPTWHCSPGPVSSSLPLPQASLLLSVAVWSVLSQNVALAGKVR